jgi:hypothetical protein
MEILVILGPAFVVGMIAAYQNHTSLRAPVGVGFAPDAGRAQLELVNRREEVGHVS